MSLWENGRGQSEAVPDDPVAEVPPEASHPCIRSSTCSGSTCGIPGARHSSTPLDDDRTVRRLSCRRSVRSSVGLSGLLGQPGRQLSRDPKRTADLGVRRVVLDLQEGEQCHTDLVTCSFKVIEGNG